MMKIPSAMQTTYKTIVKEVYSPLMSHVDSLFLNRNSRWHYVSRIKELESYIQKIETGRYKTPFLEDIFACTLVVENPSSIPDAMEFIKTHFDIRYQRPENITKTKKWPHSFSFDDLRLYASLKLQKHQYKLKNLEGRIFEIQVKTFLQHAWSVATHGLIYKTDSVSWAEERIAYQIKASLEHMDLSLTKEAIGAKEMHLKVSNAYTDSITETISILKAFWGTDSLPKDIKRLADTIYNILRRTKISTQRILEIVTKEKEEGRGPNLKNISPYSCIIEMLLKYESDKIVKAIGKEWISIFVPRDITVSEDVWSKISGKVVLQSQMEYTD